MIEQELSDQRLDLGKILSADGPAQRGSILTGRLSITMPAKGAEDESSVLAQDGRLRLPLVGEDCAFGSLVLTTRFEALRGYQWRFVISSPAVSTPCWISRSFAIHSRFKVEHCEPCSIDDVVSHYEMSELNFDRLLSQEFGQGSSQKTHRAGKGHFFKPFCRLLLRFRLRSLSRWKRSP